MNKEFGAWAHEEIYKYMRKCEGKRSLVSAEYNALVTKLGTFSKKVLQVNVMNNWMRKKGCHQSNWEREISTDFNNEASSHQSDGKGTFWLNNIKDYICVYYCKILLIGRICGKC